jgi:hypothetical protein
MAEKAKEKHKNAWGGHGMKRNWKKKKEKKKEFCS